MLLRMPELTLVKPRERKKERNYIYFCTTYKKDKQTLNKGNNRNLLVSCMLCRRSTRGTSSSRKNKKSSPIAVTEIEMEMAFADVLVSSGCDVAVVDSSNELALLIAQLTKAIAEEPYKKQKRSCEEQAQFYMSGDNKRCVPVDRDGHGLSRLWQQMVGILPQSSLETARAVTAQYKSPLDLYEDLQTPDGETRLAAVGVSRAAVPGSKARRLGPEFARKMRILFTARDGNTLVD